MSEQTYIDGNLLSTYHANLVDYSVAPVEQDGNVLTTAFSAIPIPLNGTFATRKIKLTIDFNATSTKSAAQVITDLMQHFFVYTLTKRIEIRLPDGFGYTVCFLSCSEPDHKSDSIEQATLTFVGFRHTDIIHQTFTNVKNGATSDSSRCYLPSPVIIKITPRTSASTFWAQIGTHRINFTDITDYVIVDSLNSTVTDADGNAFHKCDLTEFPMWNSNNVITWQTQYNSNVEITAYPVQY